MSKANRLYKIFMTSMIVIIAGILLATGIIAIQKSMKLNAKIQMLPFADIEIWAENEESEILLFRNFDKSEEDEISVNKDYTSISGNTLALKDLFVTTFETEFTITVKNFSSHGINVDLSSTATVEGVENATGVPATITPANQKLGACSNYESPTTAAFKVVVEAVVPQKTNIIIEIGELPKYVLLDGPTINSKITTNATSVTFDYFDNWKNTLNINWADGEFVSIDGDEDSETEGIRLFSSGTNNRDKYILSYGEIYANSDCSKMFYKCYSIKGLNFENFHTDNVTKMSYMLALGDLSDPVRGDLSYLVRLPFNTSQVTDMSYMFYYTILPSTLDLSNFDTSSVTSMECMFMECPGLTRLNLSGCDTSNVTDMGGMFLRCMNLTSLDLSGWDTSSVTDMSSMFASCGLTSLDLSSFDTSSVTDMGDMFSGCSNLTSLDLSSFDTSSVTNMWYMFSSCSNLTTIYVSDKWSTAKVTSSILMFSGCTKLVGAIVYDSTKDDANYANYTTGYLTKKDETS